MNLLTSLIFNLYLNEFIFIEKKDNNPNHAEKNSSPKAVLQIKHIAFTYKNQNKLKKT